jgi:hypothetical protein
MTFASYASDNVISNRCGRIDVTRRSELIMIEIIPANFAPPGASVVALAAAAKACARCAEPRVRLTGE